MARRVQSWFLLIAVLCGGMLGSGRQAQACSPTATPEGASAPTPYTVEAHIQDADVIVEGTVVAFEGTWPNPAEIAVTRYLKGGGPTVVLVAGFGSGDDCRPSVAPGYSGIFYTSGHADEIMYLEWLHDAQSLRVPLAQTMEALGAQGGGMPMGIHPLLAQTAQATSRPNSGRATSTPEDTMEGMGSMEGAPSGAAIWLPLLGAGGVLALVLALTLRAVRRRRSS